jgi:outer membrane protein assembly factor BamA
LISKDSLENKLCIQKKFNDSIHLFEFLKEFQLKKIKKGFLICSYDSIEMNNNTYRIQFYQGPKIHNAKIQIPDYLKNINLFSSQKSFSSTNIIQIKSHEIEDLMRKVQNQCINDGYPFSQVSLTDIVIRNDTLTSKLNLTKGERITYNKIVIKGNCHISEKYLSAILGIKTNHIYEEQNIRSITAQLQQLPFISQTKPYELLFNENQVDIYLYLQDRPVSFASGILGFQQKPNTTSYSLTGDIRLKLINVLKKGEMLDIQWRNPQPSSQFLKSVFSFPSILASRFGIDGQFQLYKKDSTFIELRSNIGVQYILPNGNYLKFNVKNIQTNPINISQNTLPSFYTNNKSILYGLSLFKQSLDYVPVPTKGYLYSIDVSIGTKKTKIQNEPIISSSVSRIEGYFNTYKSIISRKNILKVGIYTELYFSDTYYQNELLRFGGLSSQRGFREDDLKATSRIQSTIEYRFVLEKNSYVFLFYDQTWYENKLSSQKIDHPLGLGGGLTLGTSAGLFSISYAIGKQLTNPILVKNGLVHFGYISYF